MLRFVVTVVAPLVMQCHGASGKGDGPAAANLEPKPAIHANIAFEQVPTEYLYNMSPAPISLTRSSAYCIAESIQAWNWTIFAGSTISKDGTTESTVSATGFLKGFVSSHFLIRPASSCGSPQLEWTAGYS